MNIIHIALAFDNNYAEQALVLITSILFNKGDEKIHLHIIDGGINSLVKNQILEFKDCQIEFHIIDDIIFKNYQKSDYYSASMLCSMILPDIISVDKLIYLDSDIIVNSSLEELWKIDLKNNYIAAVEDANGKKYVKKFGLKKSSKFFNSGVMLVNCEKWRRDNISERAVKISMDNTGTRFGYDQTVLNQLFEGYVKFLDLKWNLQYCPLSIWVTYDDIKGYERAILHPKIIHYVGDYKPWKKGLGCFNPKQKEYFEYHKKTSYALTNYENWLLQDKLTSYKGIFAFIKRYPLFFLKGRFWKNLIKYFYPLFHYQPE